MSDWIKTLRFDRNSANAIPKQLEIMLRRVIVGEYVSAGDRLPTARFLARELKIAYKNVDKALVELTREGLIDRVPGKGSFVRDRRGRTVVAEVARRRVAFLTVDGAKRDHPYLCRVVEGARETLEAEGVDLTVLGVNDYEAAGKDWWGELDKLPGAAAAIIDTEGLLIAELFRFMETTRLPVTVVNSHFSIKYEKLPVIIPEYAVGARALMDRLLAFGHRRIGLLLESPLARFKKSDGDKRRAYSLALETAGFVPRDEDVVVGVGDEVGRIADALEHFSRLEEAPTAIACADDIIAFRVIEILKARGKRIPEDISVTGFNNFDIGYVSAPKITTVSVPAREVGALAGKKTLSLMNGGYESNETYLPVSLIARESDGPAPRKPNRSGGKSRE